MKQPSRAFTLAFLVALALTACESPRPATPPLPRPAQLDALDAPVRRLFEDRHASLERVLRDEPSTERRLAHAYGAVGEIHFAYDSLDTAERAFELAAHLAPAEPRWRYLLAHVQQDLGRPEEARAQLERVLEIAPDHVQSLSMLGELAAQQGAAERTEALFEKVLRLDPSHVRARAELAILALEHDKPEAAQRHLDEALARQPAAAPLHYLAGQASRALGDEAAARRHFERVPSQNVTQTKLLVDDPWMLEIENLRIGARRHDQRAMRALAAGRYGLAAVELRQALAANPDRVYARHGLGVALFRLGRTEEALEELRLLLEQVPDHVPSLALRASILIHEERLDEAETTLDRARELAPDDEETQRQYERWLAASGTSDAGDAR